MTNAANLNTLVWHNVNSSNIREVAWANGKLYIAFHSGGVYEYDDVEEYILGDILRADSAGRYVDQYVVHNYKYTRVL